MLNKNPLVRFAHFAAGIFKLQLFVPHHSRSKLPGIEHSWSNKKGIEIQTLIWLLIAFIIIVIGAIAIGILLTKGENAISYLQDIFRFGT
jgi:accessory gene regulator protein AgrB